MKKTTILLAILTLGACKTVYVKNDPLPVQIKGQPVDVNIKNPTSSVLISNPTSSPVPVNITNQTSAPLPVLITNPAVANSYSTLPYSGYLRQFVFNLPGQLPRILEIAPPQGHTYVINFINYHSSMPGTNGILNLKVGNKIFQEIPIKYGNNNIYLVIKPGEKIDFVSQAPFYSVYFAGSESIAP